MSNPFLTPGTPAVRLEMQKRERFRIGVYTSLAGLAIFLVTMLFQGCQKSHNPAESVSTSLAQESASNTVAVVQPALVPGTNATASNAQPATLASAPAAAETPPTNAVAAPPLPAVSEPVVEKPQAAASVSSTYIIKRGDSLSRIARTHHTTVAAIKTANSLKTDRIVAGMRLTLPAADASAGR